MVKIGEGWAPVTMTQATLVSISNDFKPKVQMS